MNVVGTYKFFEAQNVSLFGDAMFFLEPGRAGQTARQIDLDDASRTFWQVATPTMASNAITTNERDIFKFALSSRCCSKKGHAQPFGRVFVAPRQVISGPVARKREIPTPINSTVSYL